MALYSETNFNKDKPAGFDGIFSWDFLKPAFQGTKIEPMDLDAVVERNGHVLVFETKDSGKEIPYGQKITLKTLWFLGCTIFHVSGKCPNTIDGLAIYYEGKYSKDVNIGDKKLVPCDYRYVIYRASCWFDFANKTRH